MLAIASFITRPSGLDCLPKPIPIESDTAEGSSLVQKEHGLHLNKLVVRQGGKEVVLVVLPWKSRQIL